MVLAPSPLKWFRSPDLLSIFRHSRGRLKVSAVTLVTAANARFNPHSYLYRHWWYLPQFMVLRCKATLAVDLIDPS
jgi:hypothetical protein